MVSAGPLAAPRRMETRDLAAKAREAWAAAGRSGEPRLWALAYFGLGPDAQAIGRAIPERLLRGLGSGDGRRHAQGRSGHPATVSAFAAVGVDELFFVPTNGELSQLDLLIAAVGATTA